MTSILDHLTIRLLARLRQVRAALGLEPATVEGDSHFADLLDSMGMVEFLGMLADDCGVTSVAIEECAGRRFGTVGELAEALHRAGILPRSATTTTVRPRTEAQSPPVHPPTWLAGMAARLPRTAQPAAAINAALDRPAGWLEVHAGIHERRVWAEEDPITAAAEAARTCLAQAGLLVEEVGALLTTSEAPPLLAGLAAALHHRLDLRPDTAALEVGGACTGFLAALWLARNLTVQVGPVLVVAVEAPSRLLTVQRGPAGEAAALFGDAAAASIVCPQPADRESIPIVEIVVGADGSAANLLQVERAPEGLIELRMDGPALAGRAVRAMADTVRQLAAGHGLAVTDLEAVVAHGGNGRMPALLARQLGLLPERVWSEAPRLGNLGSASLPVAWAAHQPPAQGPVVWTAVGAGLTSAGALTGGQPS